MTRQFYIANENGLVVDFNDNSPFRLTKIDGLAGVESSFSESQTIGSVGSTVSGAKVLSKDITLVGDIKDMYFNKRRLIDALIPASKVTIRVVDEEYGYDYYIEGNVKQAPEFDETMDVYKEFQCTLHCSYPYWKDSKASLLKFFEWVSSFRFKRSFSNTEYWRIGSKNNLELLHAINNGSDRTGFVVRFKATGSVSNPELLKINTQEHIRFSNLVMEPNDVIEVSTYENEKYCHRIRGGIRTNIYHLMDDDSTFFLLEKLDNPLRGSCSNGASHLETSLTFKNTYVGV